MLHNPDKKVDVFAEEPNAGYIPEQAYRFFPSGRRY